MATRKEYLNYVFDQLSGVEGISHRAMMGEYIIYLRGRVAAYICDGRLLVKPVAAARALLPDAPLEPPYPGAREMLLVEDTDDSGFLQRLFETIYPELPAPGEKKKK